MKPCRTRSFFKQRRCNREAVPNDHVFSEDIQGRVPSLFSASPACKSYPARVMLRVFRLDQGEVDGLPAVFPHAVNRPIFVCVGNSETHKTPALIIGESRAKR